MMRKKYMSPEFELTLLDFESILTEGLSTSIRESGSDDHKDDDTHEW